MNDAVQTLCNYPDMLGLEVTMLHPEVIMLLSELVDQSSLLLVFFSMKEVLGHKHFGD
jgi:hypothetical protein